MRVVKDFFADLDAAWRSPRGRVRLNVIGSTALMLHTGYTRLTRDSDVLETMDIDDEVRKQLIDLAGPGTAIANRHRLHLDIVASGIPFLPQVPRWVRSAELGHLTQFEIHLLGVVDVVVSKLKRFIARDADDIDAMIQRQAVPHDDFVARFRAAVEYWSLGAGADDLPRYLEHFHQVERDMFGVPETAIELPSWVADD